MRKLKTFFGIAMLCVIMVSCGGGIIDPLRPNEWNRVVAKFEPIELRIDGYEYRTRDRNEQWITGFYISRNAAFHRFTCLFDAPAPGNVPIASYITWTVTRANNAGTESGTIRRGQLRGINILDIEVFHENDLSILDQRLDIRMVSGPYQRRIDRREGNFIWTWTTFGSNYTVADIVGPGGSMEGDITEGPFAPTLKAGRLGATGRFVTILPLPPSRPPMTPCNPAFPCPPHDPSRPAYRICTCVSGGLVHVLEGSRFTAIPPSNPIEHPVDNVVIIVPVQTEPNAGTLTVYATEAMYRELVSR